MPVLFYNKKWFHIHSY